MFTCIRCILYSLYAYCIYGIQYAVFICSIYVILRGIVRQTLRDGHNKYNWKAPLKGYTDDSLKIVILLKGHFVI